MNTMFLTVRNTNRGSLESRMEHRSEMKKLAEKNAKACIITFPDGSEKEFSSAMAACRYLNLSMGVVAYWIKNGGPTRGKIKGYTARLVEINF